MLLAFGKQGVVVGRGTLWSISVCIDRAGVGSVMWERVKGVSEFDDADPLVLLDLFHDGRVLGIQGMEFFICESLNDEDVRAKLETVGVRAAGK